MFLNHRNAVALVALAGMASLVRADIPAALDLIPSDVAIVGGIESLERFQTHMAEFRKATGSDAPNKDLVKLDVFFQMPGMNRSGSAAIAIVGEIPDGAADAAPEKAPGGKRKRSGPDMKDLPMVVLAPVSDYKLLVTAMGGDPDAAVAEIKGPQNSWFIKNSGNGYVIASPKKELTESFQTKPGNMDALKKSLGPVGTRAASSGDVVMIANIPKLADRIKKGVKDATKQLDAVAAMQGGDAPDMTAVGGLTDTFTRDGQVAVLSLTMGDSGLTVDLASQFKDGSETAQMFQDKGNTTVLTAALPNKPFLFAVAADMSTPGWRKIVKGMMNMQAGGGPKAEKAEKAGSNCPFIQNIDAVEGMSGVIGYPKAGLAAGLFSETVVFVKTKDAAGYQKASSEAITKLNGKVKGPSKFVTTYAPGAATISDTKMDSWSLDVQPADPAVADGNFDMFKGFLTGPKGKFQGYTASVPGGVITTFSMFDPAAAEVLKTIKDGTGLSKSLESAAKALPADRSIEIYLGTKSIMETVSGAMAMFGQPPMVVPAEIAPVAMGASGNSGGLHLRTIVPSSVFKAVADMTKNMKGGEDPMDEEPVDAKGEKGEKKEEKPKGEKPRF